ncbi:membrane protein [Planctomycetota bacterium]|nr:membrane protein [Planctomycetota bacterium]
MAIAAEPQPPAPAPQPKPQPQEASITVEASAADSVYVPQPYQESQTFLPNAPLQKQISVREAMDLPGVLGDPLKAVASLPGVVTGGRGEFLVHGSKEGESSPNLNHLPVGYLFHLGSLHSVLSPEAIDQIDVYLGGFDTTYGDAVGGVIDVTPRYPIGSNSGYVHLGLLDSSLGFDVGLGDGWNLSFHGRRSYIDLLIPVDTFNGGGGDDKDRITTFPNYYDANLVLAWTSGRHQVSLESLLAEDEFGAELRENKVKDPAATGPLEAKYGFSSTGLRWKYDAGAYRAMTLVGYLYQWTDFRIGELNLDLTTNTWTLYHLSTLTEGPHELSAGFEIQYVNTPVRGKISNPPEDDEVDFDLTSAQVYQLDQNIDNTNYSVFVQDTVRLDERVRLRLGVRGEFADFGAYRPVAMPRGALVVDVTKTDSLALSVGQYSQRPEGYKFADQLGNPRLTDERADHYSLAWNHRASDLGEWSIEPFYKHLYDLAVVDQTARYSSSGTGNAYGVDVAGKIRGTSWYLSLAYAYQQAKRQLSAEDPGKYSFYGDVTHTAQLAGSWQFATQWSASFLAKYATGQPFTPIVGTYTYTDTNGTTRLRPVYGKPYSDRFPDYFQLNLRAAYTTTISGSPLELALEVINATNHKNVQGIEYDDQYKKKGESTGLPLLASLNATLRF